MGGTCCATTLKMRDPALLLSEAIYSLVMSSSPSAIATTGQLRASGHTYRPLRVELRENLLSALADGRDPWPGIHGFDTTVIPQLERALLAGHDIVLLGERGQGKTRLLRSLIGLRNGSDPRWPVLARRQRYISYVMAGLVGTIGFLMSTKPELW